MFLFDHTYLHKERRINETISGQNIISYKVCLICNRASGTLTIQSISVMKTKQLRYYKKGTEEKKKKNIRISVFNDLRTPRRDIVVLLSATSLLIDKLSLAEICVVYAIISSCPASI